MLRDTPIVQLLPRGGTAGDAAAVVVVPQSVREYFARIPSRTRYLAFLWHVDRESAIAEGRQPADLSEPSRRLGALPADVIGVILEFSCERVYGFMYPVATVKSNAPILPVAIIEAVDFGDGTVSAIEAGDVNPSPWNGGSSFFDPLNAVAFTIQYGTSIATSVTWSIVDDSYTFSDKADPLVRRFLFANARFYNESDKTVHENLDLCFDITLQQGDILLRGAHKTTGRVALPSLADLYDLQEQVFDTKSPTTLFEITGLFSPICGGGHSAATCGTTGCASVTLCLASCKGCPGLSSRDSLRTSKGHRAMRFTAPPSAAHANVPKDCERCTYPPCVGRRGCVTDCPWHANARHPMCSGVHHLAPGSSPCRCGAPMPALPGSIRSNGLRNSTAAEAFFSQRRFCRYDCPDCPCALEQQSRSNGTCSNLALGQAATRSSIPHCIEPDCVAAGFCLSTCGTCTSGLQVNCRCHGCPNHLCRAISDRTTKCHVTCRLCPYRPLRGCAGINDDYRVPPHRHCSSPECHGREFCVQTCTTCRSAFLLLECRGDHSVRGGCECDLCIGLTYCSARCTGCPDLLAAAASGSGGGGRGGTRLAADMRSETSAPVFEPSTLPPTAPRILAKAARFHLPSISSVRERFNRKRNKNFESLL